MHSESDIIEGCRKGEEVFQRLLFERYYRKMLGLCLRYATGADEAKDMAQEGFIKVFDNLDGFRQKSSVETWMTRIFINNAINYLKKERRTLPFESAENYGHQSASEDEEVDEHAFSQLTPEMVIEKMQQLPEGYRLVLNLYSIENYSHKEIAKELGISIGTSKSQLHKARKMLKSILKLENHDKAGQQV